jgi:hypothetical protein
MSPPLCGGRAEFASAVERLDLAAAGGRYFSARQKAQRAIPLAGGCPWSDIPDVLTGQLSPDYSAAVPRLSADKVPSVGGRCPDDSCHRRIAAMCAASA